jgi:hypothetical protein
LKVDEPTHRVQEQILVPQSKQATTISPITFQWFDTATESYQTRTFGPFNLCFHEQRAIDASIFKPLNETNTDQTAEEKAPQDGTLPDIQATQIPARLAPSQDATQLFIIPAGAQFKALRSYNRWQLVEYAGRRGWIPQPQ